MLINKGMTKKIFVFYIIMDEYNAARSQRAQILINQGMQNFFCYFVKILLLYNIYINQT